MVAAASPIADFHYRVIAHAGRTNKAPKLKSLGALLLYA